MARQSEHLMGSREVLQESPRAGNAMSNVERRVTIGGRSILQAEARNENKSTLSARGEEEENACPSLAFDAGRTSQNGLLDVDDQKMFLTLRIHGIRFHSERR